MMKLEALEVMAEAIEQADDKANIIAPFGAMTELLNEMYKEGAEDCMKYHRPEDEVFKKVDADLFVIHLACMAIFMDAWYSSKSFEEMQQSIADKLRELKSDVKVQQDDFLAHQPKAEMEA